VKDYLTANGYGASTWGSWFSSSDTLASTSSNDVMAASTTATLDPLNQNSSSVLAGTAV